MKKGLWSLKWDKDHLILLDQTKLPDEIVYIDCYSYKDVVSAIKTLAVRGAPAIGVAAGYASVLAFRECRAYSDTGLTERFMQRWMNLKQLVLQLLICPGRFLK